MLSDCIPIVINSTEVGDVYRWTISESESELLIVKNAANLILPGATNEFDGHDFKVTLPQFCAIVDLQNCDATQVVALVVSANRTLHVAN